jgi:hypothetical protein
LVTIADALSRLDIDSLKIKEEELLKLLSGSETISISNAKLMIPMSTALIFFKEQAKSRGYRITRQGISASDYSVHYIKGFDLLCYKNNKQDLHSSIIESTDKAYCLGTMNIYFIRVRLELKRLLVIP